MRCAVRRLCASSDSIPQRTEGRGSNPAALFCWPGRDHRVIVRNDPRAAGRNPGELERDVLAGLSAGRGSRLARYAISSNRAASSRDVASDEGVDMLLVDERHTPSRTQTIPITCPLYTTSKMWVDFETGMYVKSVIPHAYRKNRPSHRIIALFDTGHIRRRPSASRLWSDSQRLSPWLPMALPEL